MQPVRSMQDHTALAAARLLIFKLAASSLRVVKRPNEVLIHIGALMNDTDHLDTSGVRQIEHHMPSMRQTAIASLHVIPFPAETWVGRHSLKQVKRP